MVERILRQLQKCRKTDTEKTVEKWKQEEDYEQSHSNKICKTNQSVAKRHFYKHFSLIMSNNNFRYQSFVAVSGNLGGKVPIVDDVLSSHEQEIYPTTSLDENCIEFEFQTDRNYYVDLRQVFFGIEAQISQTTWLRYIRE